MPTPRKDTSAAHWEALASQWARHLADFRTARTARAALAQGTQLLMLKEASPHGTWRDRVNALGLSVSVAQRLMGAARRFANAPEAFIVSVGSATKLMELLPWDHADALARGEEVYGLTLDRIAPMNVAELRAAVRTARNMPAGARPLLAPPALVRLSVEEERMLRLFRQFSVPARQAMFGLAALLAQP